jgi:hypothetical protein
MSASLAFDEQFLLIDGITYRRRLLGNVATIGSYNLSEKYDGE